ncbi:cobalt-precorrin-6A reductase [Actinoallomurus sp. NBC_01490]|jgi:precorrin-6A/cobalt-precorrin-6A reductase|uniref:cobalt-precorrin-6A reductase n=1 Tax=Actinoallomurus sp. NBC_01490 TaxID=2903557 RepID=UPI002E374BC6|nr:cobalt-precorrin-6A reductase [Actinoallomurus sp. NBC_01490]
MRVLLLGGTNEARRLAAGLTRRTGFDVITSLAGRVAEPALPAGRTRVGGFGGTDGLAAWLTAERIDAVVDATHPFAAEITASAVTATTRTGVPLLVLRRPGWHEGPGDDWRRVPSLAAAADPPGDRVFLTTGRDGLPIFAGDDRRWFLLRSVEPPPPPLPPRSTVLLARGPYTVEGELELMRRHAVDVLVTKDSGGEMTAAKLTAARLLGLPVVMVDRPPMPAAPAVTTVEAAEAWLERLFQTDTSPGH